jgi:hypothetical protein
MDLALQGLQGVAGIAWLVCFIIVIIAMFKHGNAVLAIICILTSCLVIGGVIAFIVGWMRSSEWNLRTVMIIWTIVWLIAIVGGGAGYATRPG